LRARASHVELDGWSLLVADLGDILKSKRAAGRPKDRAVLDVIRKTLDEIRKAKPSR
jgi:hypothetical protein